MAAAQRGVAAHQPQKLLHTRRLPARRRLAHAAVAQQLEAQPAVRDATPQLRVEPVVGEGVVLEPLAAISSLSFATAITNSLYSAVLLGVLRLD